MLRYHNDMIVSFTLNHATQVNRETLSAQTKLDTTMCPGREAWKRQNCGTTGRRGMVLVRVIREQKLPEFFKSSLSSIPVVHRGTSVVSSRVIIAHITWTRRRLESQVIVTNSHRLVVSSTVLCLLRSTHSVDLPSQSLAPNRQYRNTVTCLPTHTEQKCHDCEGPNDLYQKWQYRDTAPTNTPTTTENDVLRSNPHACAQTAVQQMMLVR